MDAAPEIILIGSPLLGSAVWTPVRDRLEAAGCAARVLATSAAATGDPQQVLDELLAGISESTEVVLVAHSNAGAYVPQLAIDRSAVAEIFVDAVLPARSGSTPLAPEAMLDWLTELADEQGILPPWTSWWPDEDLAALFPGEESRRLVESEQPSISLDYFRQSVAAPLGWDDRPSAYIAFGDTYADELADARARGWPTQVIAGDHLHMLVDPDAVAVAILTVLDACSPERSPR